MSANIKQNKWLASATHVLVRNTYTVSERIVFYVFSKLEFNFQVIY
jgi:hypothetical protein